MATFAYRAKDRNGRTKDGKVSATDEKSARSKLRAMNLKPVLVRMERDGGKAAVAGGKSSKGLLSRFYYVDDNGVVQLRLGEELPSTRDLAIFTKQFSIMIERGVPLVQTLSLLSGQQRLRDFRNLIRDVQLMVENGSTLSDALAKYPKVFDTLFVALIRAGEVSGSLDVILRQLSAYIERIAKLKAQIKKAMIYPTSVVVISALVVIGLLTFVVPTFAEQFESAGQELPAVTQFIIDLSSTVQANTLQLAMGFAVAFWLAKVWFSSPGGRRTFDRYILRAPVIGDVMQKIAVSRFCATMSTMLTSGVSILEALTICATSSGNKIIEEFVLYVREEISRGSSFAQPLKKEQLFPPMVISMVAVGEQTGALDETLAKINEIYEDEVDNAVSAMTAMIEPAMMVIIGSIIGFIMIAMYLPVFSMAGTMGG